MMVGGTAGMMDGMTDNGNHCQKGGGGAIRSPAESGKQGQWIQNPSESFRQTVDRTGGWEGLNFFNHLL
jgi:hypothetical protein